MRSFASVAAAALLLGACAQQPSSPDSRAVLPGSDLQVSGFLGDYSGFTRVPDQPDAWQWVRPGVNWRQYTKIFIPPVEVWVNPTAQYRGIQPDLYKQMTDTFRTLTAQEFRAGGYEVVDKPGPGVLKLRYALTGITPERPELTPLDLLPIKIAVDAARAASGTDKTVIVVSGEVEARDGVTDQRLYAEVAVRRFTRDGERAFVGPGREVFPLNIPLQVTLTPIELTGGWRYRHCPQPARPPQRPGAPKTPQPRTTPARACAPKLIPYAGGGFSSYKYTETSDFGTSDEDVDERFNGFHLLGGAEYRLMRWVAVGGEVVWSFVPDALGAAGVSAAFNEDNLGGTAFRVKISVGR